MFDRYSIASTKYIEAALLKATLPAGTRWAKKECDFASWRARARQEPVATRGEVRRAITPGGFELDEDAPVGVEADAVLGERGTEEIAAKLLQAGAIP